MNEAIEDQAILAWYHHSKRDLPWRKTHDPYAVLVSEMMLQQTRVDTVLNYYREFLDRFPNVFALAQADEAAVLNAWKGLGYYSRARNLHRTAVRVAEDLNGVFPRTYEEWIKLPGIGPYIAGAVMSIAFNQRVAAVDGNVVRVISRLDGIREDTTQPRVHKAIASRVLDMMPEQHAGDFTQALMELGALVCKPVAPDCMVCPVKTQCEAYRQDAVEEIPVKKPKNKVRTVRLWVIVVQTPGAILLEHRKEETLLARMWGLPTVEKQVGGPADIQDLDKYGVYPHEGNLAGHATHIFTHQRWEMDIVQYKLDRERSVEGELEWVPWEQIDQKPIPTAFQKVLDIVCGESFA